MTRLAKTSLYGVLGLTVTIAGSTDLLACGRGRGGYGGGYGGFSRSYTTSYSQPSYHRPVYQQPVQPIVRQQPVQPVQQQPVQQQPVQQQQFQQQSVAQQRVQQQPAQSQPVQTAQTQQPQAQPQQTQTQPAQTPTQSSTAQQSALDILASFEGTNDAQTTAATPQPESFTGIGTWSATLTNGSTVTLQLDADGTFTWTAVKSGKTSTFSGTYNLSGEQLTLTRTDNQKLSGALLAAGTNGFTFKLDGVKDNGLQFARS